MHQLDAVDPTDQRSTGQADEIARQAADIGCAHGPGCYTNEGDVKPESTGPQRVREKWATARTGFPKTAPADGNPARRLPDRWR